MNEQELNKKLAEWRFPPPEFRVSVFKVYLGFIAIDRQFTQEAEDHIISEDPSLKGALKVGEWYCYENMGILTQSLDACLKYLVPEAIKKFGKDRVYIAMVDAFKHYIYKNEELALALCLAIEKLIEGE